MTDAERTAAEMRGLTRFALGLGVTRLTVEAIYQAVGQEAAMAGASDGDRRDDMRKRMLGTLTPLTVQQPIALQSGVDLVQPQNNFQNTGYILSKLTCAACNQRG